MKKRAICEECGKPEKHCICLRNELLTKAVIPDWIPLEKENDLEKPYIEEAK